MKTHKPNEVLVECQVNWHTIYRVTRITDPISLIFVLGYIYDFKLYNMMQWLRDKAIGNEHENDGKNTAKDGSVSEHDANVSPKKPAGGCSGFR